ncbi:MAG: VWA domain-containing protein [Microcystis viridis Mv_BB_P_19951000_S69]|uniref:VWA domain-containing protein n=1 Tax=Microcystis viridis Mv_BB_P_19951000_S68D TaxID=2486270 RepID=A0A552HV50_MICVR|nr:MAG: VWA domain-containing protein [Microcystis viridis Mv_BB_P_19951000_S68]TRU75094.1 MAG: VWA domain-containing protein [Microcystis viridis Mv_BB_P_19951000_S68D]TRU78443.1 MAG: VWA domain-containing protein [Microcystis viridis Mv_BB_P_19951000_S69]TRU82554.1 MAG: VWA domain-containing protein [Microcystis viridis Mv_BB_P_19951000_S69D]
MRVTLKSALSDSNIDANQSSSQRQLMLSIAATSEQINTNLPINLCLVLDHSGSMQGKPLETVKKAAFSLIESLGVNDRLSVIAFDHRAKVILPSQSRQDDLTLIRSKIQQLQAGGGTAIDEGIKLGIQESSTDSKGYVSHIFLLTDGENEHGDNRRCLKLAEVAAEYGITLNTLGFGDRWNQDILEKIADIAGGSLSYIERPEQALIEFTRLFNRLQSVRLTNAFLQLELAPQTHLADLKPIAQVAPETIEMSLQKEGNFYITRLGDLMIDEEKILLLNLYIDQIPPGTHTIAKVKIRYDDPASGQKGVETATFSLDITSQALYQSQLDEQVQKSILTLAKYRQTQIAEEKLKQGDRAAAATMLQTAAKTALQLGEKNAATVLQTNATRLQVGEELSEGDLKKTRIIAKTRLQTDGETGK